jgi:RNA polymerase sigma-70 factor (ECF subfamily)
VTTDIQPIELPSISDEVLVGRIRGGDLRLFEEVMRRHNQRLYRVARAIVQDEDEAEDVMQQAYIQAYLHLDQFSGRSRLSTWLTRIAIHEALGRRRKRRDDQWPAGRDEDRMTGATTRDNPDPERLAYAAELRTLIESSIDALPDGYRLVFMCREVEGLSTAETADALELGEEAVKTRLHRARAMLRREMFARAGSASVEAFTFYRPRCDAVVRRVLDHIARTAGHPNN